MATIPAHRRRQADAGHFRTRRPTSCIGAQQTRRLYDYSARQMENRRPAARRQPIHYVGAALDTIPATSESRLHQELPHDAWDFDSAIGEFMKVDRDGKHYIVHPNKSGFIFVYDRDLEGAECLAANSQLYLREIDRSEDWRADRPTQPTAERRRPAVPGDRRRRELEFRWLTARRPDFFTRWAPSGL